MMISKNIEKAPLYDKSPEKNRNRLGISFNVLLGYARKCQQLMTTKVDFWFKLYVGCKLAVSLLSVLHSGTQAGGAAPIWDVVSQ